MTLEQIVQANPQVDAVKLDATTEPDIRRYQIAEGFDPYTEPSEVRVVLALRSNETSHAEEYKG